MALPDALHRCPDFPLSGVQLMQKTVDRVPVRSSGKGLLDQAAQTTKIGSQTA